MPSVVESGSGVTLYIETLVVRKSDVDFLAVDFVYNSDIVVYRRRKSQ